MIIMLTGVMSVGFGMLIFLLKNVAMISGTRAYDMALHLQYDEVSIEEVDTNIPKALDNFINKHNDEPKQIFCSYTAMTTIRRLLGEKLMWRKYNDQDKNCPTLSTRYELIWRLGQH